MKNVFLILTVLICASCSRNTLLEECTTSTGPKRIEVRTVDDFSEMEVHGNVGIHWHNGHRCKVELEGGRNLLEQVCTTVDKGKLKIENTNRCNWVRSFAKDIQVHVYGKQLRVLEVKGFGPINFFDTLHSPILYIRHYGASEVHLNLKSQELYVDLNGLGVLNLAGQSQKADFHAMSVAKLRAWEFQVENLRVHQRGQSPMQVKAVEKLTGIIESDADVLLKGKPEIEVDVRSKAKILFQP